MKKIEGEDESAQGKGDSVKLDVEREKVSKKTSMEIGQGNELAVAEPEVKLEAAGQSGSEHEGSHVEIPPQEEPPAEDSDSVASEDSAESRPKPLKIKEDFVADAAAICGGVGSESAERVRHRPR